MNVASRELSQELSSLTGWDDTDFIHTKGQTGWMVGSKYYRGKEWHAAYDLGYLMRKLPERVTDDIQSTVLLGRGTDNSGWSVVYQDSVYLADTPEDACAKLAIALCKRAAAAAYFLEEER